MEALDTRCAFYVWQIGITNTLTQEIKPMNLQEIKDQVAQEAGYQSWESLSYDYLNLLGTNPEKHITRVAKLYATAAILEDRKDCAEKAYIEDITPVGNYEGRWQVDKASILDRPMPDLK